MERIDVDDLIALVRNYNPRTNEDLIRRAYDYGRRMHEGQFRHSGEPYFTHPVAVAAILTEMRLDDATIVTALLHDTIEDTGSTYGAVARRFGAGEHSGAARAGIDGLWLALGLGVVLAVVGSALTPWLAGLFGATPDVTQQAVIYLQLSMWGLPAMLIVFAATGLLRGMQNTVTPLWIAGFGFGLNALLNWLFIYGFGWGIAGSAAGTVVAPCELAPCQFSLPPTMGLAWRKMRSSPSVSLP